MDTQELLPDPPDIYPLLSERIQSTFIDMIFIVALMFAFSSMLETYENAPDWIRIALFIGIWVIYEPVCTSLGCTLGNYIKSIRVRRHNDMGKRINIFQALVRYIIKVFLGWLSFVTINTNVEKRAIHDLVAGSLMIKLK
jgi:uncharacterized RDD family membrane protein YckC